MDKTEQRAAIENRFRWRGCRNPSQIILIAGRTDTSGLLIAITVFFAAFNVMEAALPSLITTTAPPDAKGTATGVHSTAQFFGIFVGGSLGGWVRQMADDSGVLVLTAAIAGVWLLVAATMPKPIISSSVPGNATTKRARA